jgi:glycosyltransferase involved in cell wall biosynthesis
MSKVFLLLPSLDAGGTERQAVLLANGLAARGWDAGLVLCRRQGPLLAEVAPQVRTFDLAKTGRADVAGFLWRLARLLRAEQPHVLYSFLGTPNLAAALLRPLLPGVRLAWGLRAGPGDVEGRGLLARVCQGAETLLAGMPDAIVANSEAGRAAALARGFPAHRLAVVPNGVDTARFRPDRAAGAALRAQWGGEGGRLVGLVARLDPAKDHATFLRAAALLAREDERARFVCVGDGPLAGPLRILARDLGLEARLAWAGERRDMPAVYNALEVCCLSSRSEGFPNALAEAMACGLPCVGTDAGDVREILGETGLVTPGQDPAALALALGRMLQEPGGRGRAARARVLERYSLERLLDRAEALLLGLIRRP